MMVENSAILAALESFLRRLVPGEQSFGEGVHGEGHLSAGNMASLVLGEGVPQLDWEWRLSILS